LIQKRRTKKKGRVMKVTRPKPTIYGNCDSWNFIVGKTRRAYSRWVTRTRPLPVCHANLVHRFSTILESGRGDNMWAICGSAAAPGHASRMVVDPLPDMPGMEAGGPGFYPIWFLGPATS
jgi:hypothetical protein